jgi:signal transduction histidine kinase
VSLAGSLAVFVALLAAYVDWMTWIGLNVSVVYGLPLVLSIATRNRRLLWGMTVFLLIATFAVYAFQITPLRFSPIEPFFMDRVLAASTLLVIACLVHYRMAALDTTQAQRRALRSQNEELDWRRREAEEASRRKTRLLASASHDVRTPVYAITLLAEGIRQAAKSPSLTAQIPALAEQLQTSALSLDRLIADLLDVAQLDSGGILLQETTFSLNDLLVEQCNALLPLARAKGLRLEAEAFDRPVWLHTDRVKVARAIANLLGNAIKFTREGRVSTSISVAPEHVLIRVRDTGVGIPAEHLGHIFDEFARLQNEKSGDGEGWGLGLPISRRLIKALGGSITVESEPGRGSVFIVSLPARCAVDVEAVASVASVCDS